MHVGQVLLFTAWGLCAVALAAANIAVSFTTKRAPGARRMRIAALALSISPIALAVVALLRSWLALLSEASNTDVDPESIARFKADASLEMLLCFVFMATPALLPLGVSTFAWFLARKTRRG